MEQNLINSYKNNKDNILIFDLETTGLPERKGFNEYYPPSGINYYNNSRMIEIGYMVFSNDGIILDEVNHLISHKESVNITNTNIHGITNEMVENDGINIEDVLGKLYENLKYTNKLVAHNINFDINILLSECYRLGNQHQVISEITSKNLLCTMEIGKKYLKQNRYPKLIDLHNKIFNKNIVQEHRALSDVKFCAECFFVMKQI